MATQDGYYPDVDELQAAIEAESQYAPGNTAVGISYACAEPHGRTAQVNAARYARLRQIRQHTHADADAASFGQRMEDAVTLAKSDTLRADAYNKSCTNDVPLGHVGDADAYTDADALHMAATWQMFA